MLAISDDKFIILTTGRFTRYTPYVEMYGIGYYNKSTDSISLSEPIWLDYGRDVSNKNYVAILYEEKLYFVVSINPLVVITLLRVDEENNGITELVHEGQTLLLPWSFEEYGSLRGTNVLLLNCKCNLLYIESLKNVLSLLGIR